MDSAEFISQVTSAAIVVYGLQWAKRSRIVPFLTEQTKRLSRLASGLLAAVGAAGVHYTFDPQAGELVIRGLTLSAILHSLWAWLNQFALQQLMYDGVAQKPTIPSH